MLNVVVIMGRLVADPELRTTTNGINLARFRIACDRSYSRQSEQRQTDFLDVVAWRQQADFVCKYFQKGSLIIIEGSIQSRQYQDKDNGVLAVASHESGREETQLGEEPGEQRNFEYEPHCQRHDHQGRYVGLQADQVGHPVADLIGPEKTEGQWKDQKVATDDSGQKHGVTSAYHPHGIPAFVGVEGRGDEAVKLIENVGRGTECSGRQGGLHLDDELAGQPGVDERNADGGIGRLGKPRSDGAEQTIGDEVLLLWSQHGSEKLFLQAKRDYGEQGGYDNDS